jgi:hypothetical protein
MLQIRKLAFAIKNSSTIILPQWFRVLEELALDERVMPRDVRTRWNSTYDMVDFAYTYKDAIMNITAIRDMKLRDYEIDEDEWEIIKQLRDVLKVRHWHFTRGNILTNRDRFLKMERSFSLVMEHPVSRPSFQQWTILISIWPQLRLATNTILPSELHWQLERRHSIDITIAQTIRRSIELQ